MTYVRAAWLLGALIVAGLCVMAATGFTEVVAPLVTLAVLVGLVGGGNWLSGRSGMAHAAPRGATTAPGPGGPGPVGPRPTLPDPAPPDPAPPPAAPAPPAGPTPEPPAGAEPAGGER